MSARERLLKTLAYSFEPPWCGRMGCGGNHPKEDRYCDCSMQRAKDILEKVEDDFELVERPVIEEGGVTP